MKFIYVHLSLLVTFVLTIEAKTLSEKDASENAALNVPNANSTDDVSFKQSISSIIASIAGAVTSAVTQQVANTALGNTLVTTSELCPFSTSGLGADAYCDRYCNRFYRRAGPMRGFCQSGLSLCACKCDQLECERFCRNYGFDYDWDDWDKKFNSVDTANGLVRMERNPNEENEKVRDARQRYGYGRCYSRGCRCN